MSKQKPKSNKAFWDREYTDSKNFSLSERPSEDLVKFTRWQERDYGRQFLNVTTNVLDLGCGNGRNLIFLADEFGCHGVGYDISEVGIKQAKENSKILLGETKAKLLRFEARSLAGSFDLPDNSFDIVLDMMSSHYLFEEERKNLIKEIGRVIKPNGWLFYKTFLLEDDINAHRMIRENPSGEVNSYIHPTIGVMEHVSTESEIRSLYEPFFNIEKIEKSGKYIIHGRAGKRRSIIVYMRKK
jgi:SAM-dependent methyltransferase